MIRTSSNTDYKASFLGWHLRITQDCPIKLMSQWSREAPCVGHSLDMDLKPASHPSYSLCSPCWKRSWCSFQFPLNIRRADALWEQNGYLRNIPEKVAAFYEEGTFAKSHRELLLGVTVSAGRGPAQLLYLTRSDRIGSSCTAGDTATSITQFQAKGSGLNKQERRSTGPAALIVNKTGWLATLARYAAFPDGPVQGFRMVP